MKKLTTLCLAACLAAALATPAEALDCVGTSSISLAQPHAAGLAHSAAPPFPTKSYDFAGTLYHFDAPDGPDYGKPTSVEVVHTADGGALKNEDVSKNAALVPPGFGSASADTLNTGTWLTPNLAPEGMAVGTISGSGMPIVFPPSVDSSTALPTEPEQETESTTLGYTPVTSDLYYASGHLGTLKIPAIDLSVRVYEGTDSSTLMKGAGHFEGTSIWDGNVSIAGHNRGVRDDFGDLHTLERGDTITWITKLGTRTYEVTSVEKVKETDTSGTAPSTENMLTLYTCVRNQREYRWQVQAVEVV